jgi:putative endonuclease
MYYFYILVLQRDGKSYYGYTGNINRRLYLHNAGKVRSTEHRRPVKLIYCEEYADEMAARKRELYVKKSGRERSLLKKRLGYK